MFTIQSEKMGHKRYVEKGINKNRNSISYNDALKKRTPHWMTQSNNKEAAWNARQGVFNMHIVIMML